MKCERYEKKEVLEGGAYQEREADTGEMTGSIECAIILLIECVL